MQWKVEVNSDGQISTAVQSGNIGEPGPKLMQRLSRNWYW